MRLLFPVGLFPIGNQLKLCMGYTNISARINSVIYLLPKS
jgi:hypothetical protein